jgi:hypothetical protein
MKSEEILTMPADLGCCRNCGTSDIDRDHFVEYRIVCEGNRGKIVCATCGDVAWNVRERRTFENIPGEQIDQLLEALQALGA